MRGGVVLIALALLIAYLGVTGRYRCFALFVSCLTDTSLGEGYTLGGATTQGGSKAGGDKIIVGSNTDAGDAPVYDATTHLFPIESFV